MQQRLIFAMSKGNMAEYVLPAVLIGMVAVAGLSWALNGQFAAQGGRSLFQAETSSVGQNGKALLNSRSFGKNPYLQTYTLTLANGKTIQIPDMPVSVANNIDVDGGQGTTDKLLAALEKLRQALVDSGELTEAESQPFKDLANAGHGFGESQAFMENIMNQCGTSKQCVTDALFQNNQPLPIWVQSRWLSQQNALGHTNTVPDVYALSESQRAILKELQPGILKGLKNDPSFNFDDHNLRVGVNLLNFLTAYDNVKKLPVFADPGVGSLVSKLTQNIMTLQRSSFNSVTEVMGSLSVPQILAGVKDASRGDWADKTPDKYINGLKDNFNRILPNEKDRTFRHSDITHAISGVICTTGNGSDTGQQCQ
jgi:hypothetical protein